MEPCYSCNARYPVLCGEWLVVRLLVPIADRSGILFLRYGSWGILPGNDPLPGQPVCSIHGCDLFFAVLEWFREQQNPSRVYSCEKCVVLQWLFSWRYFYNVEDPFFSVFTNFLFIPFIRNKLTTIMTNNKGSLLIDFLN